jgi:hypothetical protein
MSNEDKEPAAKLEKFNEFYLNNSFSLSRWYEDQFINCSF